MITYNKVKQKNFSLTLQKALEKLLDKLQLCQRALGADYIGKDALRTSVIRACRSSPEFEIALFKPARVCEKLFADLRSVIEVVLNRSIVPQSSALENTAGSHYVNQVYNKSKRPQQQTRLGRSLRQSYQNRPISTSMRKKCFVCQKKGCWSTKHPPEKRKRSQKQYILQYQMRGEDPGNYAAFFADCESSKHLSNSSDSDSTYDNPNDREAAISINYLINQTFLYKVTNNNMYTFYVHDNENALMKTATKFSKAQPTVISPDYDFLTAAEQFFIEDRYSNHRFQGILPDTDASKFSTAGKGQFLALQREDPLITLNTRQAGVA
jgi:hypothetical protein